jgi:NADPH:quinone reductase-like Zn-dependent oxidoreductase
LINGAGGGVGALGLQIAKEYGCEVTGVDRDFKLGALKSLGFDHVVDYLRSDFTGIGEQYDLILDAKTTRSPFRYLVALKPRGRYVTVGGHLPRILQVALLGPYLTKRTGKRLRVLALKPNRGLDQITRLSESQALQSLIDGPYRLDDVPKSLARFGEAKHIGKIVIAVASSP